jgi:recombinational DNA repair protein RecR
MQQVKYPGWRTMSAAQRYNAKKDRIFSEAKALQEKYKTCELCGKFYTGNRCPGCNDCPACGKEMDDDGRCGCTNKDGK